MYQFFNIESPLQLLSAISAAKKLHVKESILLVNLSKGNRQKNDAQILELIDYDFWGKVIIHKKSSGLKKDFVTAYRMLKLRQIYKGKVDKYFFGEYRNFNMALLSGLLDPQERVLLDDGSFTITAQNYYISQGNVPYDRSLRSKVFARILKKNLKPNLYSFFKLDLVAGQINYYELPTKKTILVNEQEAYFFGSKFSERKNMSLEQELNILKKITSVYAGYKLLYIPHRDESQEKLNRIVGLGYYIKNLGRPAELFFDETNVMPKLVISYYSTILYTCYIRFSNIDIVSIDIEKELVKKNAKLSAREIYQYYKELGIKVLDLD